MGLLVTFALGAFVLLGALFAGLAKNGQRISEISIAIALGAMTMLLINDLIPEAIEIAEDSGWFLVVLAALAGVLILVVLDKFLPGTHHSSGGASHGESALHISIAATIALVAHNLVEGMSVFSLAEQSLSLAIVLGVGVGLHNIPMGMIVYAGLRDESTARKVVVLGCAALSTFLGGLAMFALSGAVSDTIVNAMICVTIGLLLFIVLGELLPHVISSRHKGLSILFIIIGVVAVAASGMLEQLV